LTAIKSILRGELFVSRSLAGHGVTVSKDEPKSATPNPPRVEPSPHHAVAFYPDEASFLRGVGRFVETALSTGSVVIVIATEDHRISLLSTLQAQGLDIAAAIEQGRYTALDAADALSTIMLSGMPDPVRFLKQLGSLIETAAKAVKGEQSRVAIFGERVHLLWAQGNAEAAIQVEKLCSQLAKAYDVDILCGYFPSAVQGGMEADIFHRICAEHSVVYGLGY
jgi:hypothetical protein